MIFPLGYTSLSEEEVEAEMKLEGNLEEGEKRELLSEATEATEASKVKKPQTENDTINSESNAKVEKANFGDAKIEEEKVEEELVDEREIQEAAIEQMNEKKSEEAKIEGENVVQAKNAENESVKENSTEI